MSKKNILIAYLVESHESRFVYPDLCSSETHANHLRRFMRLAQRFIHERAFLTTGWPYIQTDLG